MTMPDEMTAIEITSPGGPEALAACRRPVPSPEAGEVLIRVAAAGVNRPDLMQRTGAYPPPPGASDLPGLEVAGEIVRLGSEVRGWSAGDRVCALVSGGGYAQYCAAPAPQCLPIPPGLSEAQAAALPETFFTVWTNVFERGALLPGERMLVHGGASGIGTTAIQLARAFGASVYATAGSAEKCAACRSLGASEAFDYRRQDFVEGVRKATEGAGVDLILDMVGGDYLARNLKCLAAGGRLVQIALLGGAKTEINLAPIMTRRLTLTGSTLRPRSVAEKARIAASLRARVWPRLAEGSIRPVMHATFPLEEAGEAHRLMESGVHIGKIVLRVGSA